MAENRDNVGRMETLRKAEEVFIFMHRNFRVSRNIRAHWFFDHINKPVQIEQSPADDAYGREMTVVGILPKGGLPDELVEGEKFLVTNDTKVVYISRYYRHVFVLDLSPSTIVADEETNCCLHEKLLYCLRLSMESVTRSFTKPGTRRIFSPQIYISVVVFTPFLGFEEDLVLVHGILLTESNINSVLKTVTEKFKALLKSLFVYSTPILRKWGVMRRRHKNRYDSTCETDDVRESDLESFELTEEDQFTPRMPLKYKNSLEKFRIHQVGIGGRTPQCRRPVWGIKETENSEERAEGYIVPEWALIFMLRLGLIASQTLPENTQSNVIIITDGVAGMPDAQALHELLNQIRSFTVSCSFIQVQGISKSEACFGHVSSGELFHFLAMATFGAYIPNCPCENGVDMNNPKPLEMISDDSIYRAPNPFHSALLCWSFMNALQENTHITNLVQSINKEFALLMKAHIIRHLAYSRSYHSSLHQILYVRLREGFTVKSVKLVEDKNKISIHLSLPFRPSVYIIYAISAPWPVPLKKKESIHVNLVVEAPYNEIKDYLTQEGGNMVGANPTRIKLLRALHNTIESIENADSLLIHIHSFDTDPAYFKLPPGVQNFPIFRTHESKLLRSQRNVKLYEPVVRIPHDVGYNKFLEFWSVLCNMSEATLQKWVHMHFERMILRCEINKQDEFTPEGVKVDCSEAKNALITVLKERSSFCLIKDTLYITMVYKDEEKNAKNERLVDVEKEVDVGENLKKKQKVNDVKAKHKAKEEKMNRMIKKIREREYSLSNVDKESDDSEREDKDEHEEEFEESDEEESIPERVPSYFYMTRVCWDAPCVIMKTAFLGGIPSIERREVVDKFRRQLLNLKIVENKDEESKLEKMKKRREDKHRKRKGDMVEENERETERPEMKLKKVEALSLIRRPMERILVRYQTIPFDVRTIVRISPSDKGSARELTMHNAISKYLECRRRIWKLEPEINPSTTIRKISDYILSALFHRRLLEGFKIAWTWNGIICLARQVIVESGPALEQYVMFPPLSGALPPQFDGTAMCRNDPYSFVGEDEDDLSLVAEYWREPCAVCKSEVLKNPDGKFDDDLVSALFCMDQLLGLEEHCEEDTLAGPIVVTPSRLSLNNEEGKQPVSGCVTVVSQSFNLHKLLEQSRRVLYHMPTFENASMPHSENRMLVFLDALHTHFSNTFSVMLEVTDPEFYRGVISNTAAQLPGNPYKEKFDSNGLLSTDYRTPCRIYMDIMSAWVVSLVIVPDVCEEAAKVPSFSENRDTYPLLLALLDEVQMVYALVKKINFPHPVEVDARRNFHEEACGMKEMPILDVSPEWVSSIRVLKLATCNYQPHSMRELVEDVTRQVVERSFVTSFYNLQYENEKISSEDALWILEGMTTYSKKEIIKVETVVQKFCGHLNPAVCTHSENEYCNERLNLKDTFDEILAHEFRKIQIDVTEGLEPSYYFYYPPDEEEDRKPYDKDLGDLPTFDNEVCHQVPIARRISTDQSSSHSDEDDGTLSDTAETESVSESISGSSQKMRNNEEIPMFLYFDCTLLLENGQQTSFPLASLPTCAKQLLDMSPEKFEIEDMTKVKVRMTIYVMTWSDPYEDEEENGETEGMPSKKREEFWYNLPKKYRQSVQNLLRKIKSALELESVLMDSRQDKITEDVLEGVSRFIEIQHSKGTHGGRIEEKTRENKLVIHSEEALERFKTRIEDMKVNYTQLRRCNNSNLYYACQVDEPVEFNCSEHRLERKSSSLSMKAKRNIKATSATQSFTQSDLHTSFSSSGDGHDESTDDDNVYSQSAPEIDMIPWSKDDCEYDFWILLRVDEDTMTMQFCQRNGSNHEKVADLIWRKCRQVMRLVNQEILLDRMYERRECDPLMLCPEESWQPSRNRTSVSSDIGEFECLDPSVRDSARYTYAPGYFSCAMQEIYWFDVHPRMKRKINPHGEAEHLVRLGLEQFAVRNIPNLYVFKEDCGNVLYMQVFTDVKVFKENMKKHSMHVRRDAAAEIDAKLEDKVLMTVYGVELPGPYFNSFVENRLRKRVHSAILERIIDVWSRNNRSLLEPEDVTFIQTNPCDPCAMFFLSIPSQLESFLSAASFYIHQHVSMQMPSARFRSQEERFQAFPAGGTLADTYQPFFYLYVRPAKTGVRSSGIAAIEIRITTPEGKLEPLSNGILRQFSHNALVRNIPDEHLHLRYKAFRELTKTLLVDDIYDPEKQIKGICGYVQVIIWQAGDVGVDDLQAMIHALVEQAFCDVITEYGVMNLDIIRAETIGGSANVPTIPTTPASPHIHTGTRSSFLGPNSKASQADRKQMKKRDSSDTSHSLSNMVHALSMFAADGKRNAFKFDDKRVSFSSTDLAHSATKPLRRVKKVNKQFYPHVTHWLDYVIGLAGNHSDYTTVSKLECQFDCLELVRSSLGDIGNMIKSLLNVDQDPSLHDEVYICRYVQSRNQYELVNGQKEMQLSMDLGYCPENRKQPEYLIIGFAPIVAQETLRYGYDENPAGDPPLVLQQLEKYHEETPKEDYLPSLKPFIPRQRLMVGTVQRGLLSVYFYNFHFNAMRTAKDVINRAVLWQNARGRALLEINLHKMGITGLSPAFKYKPKRFTKEQLAAIEKEKKRLAAVSGRLEDDYIIEPVKPVDNPYMDLVWGNPEILIKNNLPLREIRFTVPKSLPHFYADKLFRPCRVAHTPIHEADNKKCLIKETANLMIEMRQNVVGGLEKRREFSTYHERMRRYERPRIKENGIRKFFSAARRVHFVQTPVLIFPSWRRKIAEVRGIFLDPQSSQPKKEKEEKKTRASSSTVFRSRTGTGGFGILSGSRAPPPPPPPQPKTTRPKSEEDDANQQKVLNLLMEDYVRYLKTLGLKRLEMNETSSTRKKPTAPHAQNNKTQIDKKPKREKTPHCWLYIATKGGVIIVRLSFRMPYFILTVGMWCSKEVVDIHASQQSNESNREALARLEIIKDHLVSKCHIHSFTYDFHLRIMTRYLTGKDQVLLSRGYNTGSFLIGFLKYYDCRPPNARNCVYEDRPTFFLKYDVKTSKIWEFFLDKHHQDTYGWKVLMLKGNEDDVDLSNPEDDHMIVSFDNPSKGVARSYEKLRILLPDRRRPVKPKQIHLVQYLILIDSDQTRPLEEVIRRRNRSSRNEVGEFRNVHKARARNTDAEVDRMMKLVASGGLPTVEGGMPKRAGSKRGGSIRRRFSSGGAHTPPPNISKLVFSDAESPRIRHRTTEHRVHSDSKIAGRVSVQSSGTLRHRRAVGSEYGDIPGETVTYVQFLSVTQRRLQQMLENAAKDYGWQLEKAIESAEFVCYREVLWIRILEMPRATTTTSTTRLQPLQALQAQFKSKPVIPNRLEDPWGHVRLLAGNHEAKWSDLDNLLTIVDRIQMEEREPRLRGLLEFSDCGRLCCFLIAKFKGNRCRFLEVGQPSSKRCLLITTHDANAMCMIECNGKTSPTLSMLAKESPAKLNAFSQCRLDTDFDEFVQCVTAFLWADLLQKPPGKAISGTR